MSSVGFAFNDADERDGRLDLQVPAAVARDEAPSTRSTRRAPAPAAHAASAWARTPVDLTAKLALCMAEPDRVLFLDVETTGLSHYYDETTVVGWSIGGKAATMVKGQCHRQLAEDAANAVALITFNGIRFDQRFLAREYPDVPLPRHHLDLMYLCRRVGLTGGQKAIERSLGIELREGFGEMDGSAAVLLWHRYLRGDTKALESLVRYNRADIAAMGWILDRVLDRLGVGRDLFSERTAFAPWAGPKNRDELPAFEPAVVDPTRKFDFEGLLGRGAASAARIVGIDLTGSEARGSGWCLLEGRHARVETVFRDADLLERTMSSRPDLVSMDSPLCLPAGRVSVDDADPGRHRFGIMRECERELKRRGVNVYPCLLPSMQKLTARGMRLAAELRANGVPVIESYPGAAQDIMRIPRKGAGIEWLRLGLTEFGLSGDLEVASHDELDAVTSALVGSFHWVGLSEPLGTPEEPPLIIPKPTQASYPVIVGISGPIAAGKTTLARALEACGFAYTRFSQVIDEELAIRGLMPDRKTRQELGGEINRAGRQRWLAERTLARVGDSARIVVDGLRFPDDHAFMAEHGGAGFFHVFMDADESVRRGRYLMRSDDGDFDAAAAADVEQGVEALRCLAHLSIRNQGTQSDLENKARELVSTISGVESCPSR